VLRAQEAGQANQKIPDAQVLDFATKANRAILTLNRWHFIRLHKSAPKHSGIIVCTKDDVVAFAQRISEAITDHEPLDNKLIRVNKP
jgi:hypothetical protein